MPALSIHVTGQVQGVFFRSTAQEKARALRLTGWIRNTRQGGVEIHAEGEIEDLHALEEWCRHGPPSATVDSVTVQKIEEQHFPEFNIVL